MLLGNVWKIHDLTRLATTHVTSSGNRGEYVNTSLGGEGGLHVSY